MPNHSYVRVIPSVASVRAAFVVPWSEVTAIAMALGGLVLSCCAFLLAATLIHSLARASDRTAPRMYEVITETGMPHLEENLRYTITHEKRCLGHDDLASAFPVLTHSALKGCTLVDETRRDDVLSFLLVCEGGHGTTGHATWRIGEHRISGQLNVRLGGKNLTFYQRVTGTPLGTCD